MKFLLILLDHFSVELWVTLTDVCKLFTVQWLTLGLLQIPCFSSKLIIFSDVSLGFGAMQKFGSIT